MEVIITTRPLLWLGPQERTATWRRLGASPYLCRAIQFGVYETPSTPFKEGGGKELGDVPQSPQDVEFACKDLEDGCRAGIYEKISPQYAMREGSEGLKGRFVVNLSKRFKHLKKGTVRMESMSAFSTQIQRGDHFISMDIRSGYRHLRLSARMRDWFMFRYAGCYYRYIALPFEWGRSPLWFTEFMVPFLKALRCILKYRVLAYLDDFLVAASLQGKASSSEDCRRATLAIDDLTGTLSLLRHPKKGCWKGSTLIEHLGVAIDSVAMRYFVTPRKVEKVQLLAKRLFRDVRHGPRWVSRKALEHFCGVCISLSIAMPWARFYTRSLYWDMSKKNRHGERRSREGTRCRLSHQCIRDLRIWQQLSKQELQGRNMTPFYPTATMHTAAADLSYGETLSSDPTPGRPGELESQRVWNWKDRSQSITLRELKAIRLLLMGNLGQELEKRQWKKVLLRVDNSAVVHITNSLVSASRPMMRELRRLKRVLDEGGIQIRTEWIPSVANQFADALSRRFPHDDLQIRQQLRHSVQGSMNVPLDVFPYRPLGEHPVFQRRQAYTELSTPWEAKSTRLLSPPLDLMLPTVQKVIRTGTPAVLLMPDWPRQAWHQFATQVATRVTELPQPPEEIWEGARRINPQWRTLMLEMNLPVDEESSHPVGLPHDIREQLTSPQQE